MVLVHVRDIAVDRIGWCLNRALSRDRNPCHEAFLSRTGDGLTWPAAVAAMAWRSPPAPGPGR
jgi:hypothetical protein